MKTKNNWRRGAHLVEFALIVSILILFIFAIVEYGLFVMMRDLIDNAAQRGARRAIVSTDSGLDQDIQTVVTSHLAGRGFQNTKVMVYRVDIGSGSNLGAWKDAPFGTLIAVKVEADYKPLLPTFGFLPGSVKLQAVSIMCSEGK